MKKTVLCIALLTSISAHAEFWSGTKLIQILEDDQRGGAGYTEGMATGYVVGVADAISGIIQCMPSTTTVKQAKQVVFNYMKAHPEKWDLSADQVVVAALKETWPCAKN